MILILRKKTVFALVAFCLAGYLLQTIPYSEPASTPAFCPGQSSSPQIVLDPGHGGEDGGAVSPAGVAESGLNLQISLILRDLLILSGQQVVMTRTADCSLDHGEPTVRGRKASDLKARVSLANKNAPAVLISIHQNSLPTSPETHGAQVFWNQQEGADALAQAIQDNLNLCANPERPKNTRQISSAIYLMKHCAVPGVLVECGFLSNDEETSRLQEPSYQRKLAAAIAAGYLRWSAGEEIP